MIRDNFRQGSARIQIKQIPLYSQFLMTVEKPISNQLLLQFTTGANSATNQSDF